MSSALSPMGVWAYGWGQEEEIGTRVQARGSGIDGGNMVHGKGCRVRSFWGGDRVSGVGGGFRVQFVVKSFWGGGRGGSG